jgi:hypothetical protein
LGIWNTMSFLFLCRNKKRKFDLRRTVYTSNTTGQPRSVSSKVDMVDSGLTIVSL